MARALAAGRDMAARANVAHPSIGGLAGESAEARGGGQRTLSCPTAAGVFSHTWEERASEPTRSLGRIDHPSDTPVPPSSSTILVRRRSARLAR
jgi:hypothetical protein